MVQGSSSTPGLVCWCNKARSQATLIPSKAWREGIQKVWEVDPAECPNCGLEMKLVSFVGEPLPVRRILAHLDLWRERGPQGMSRPAEQEENFAGTIVCEAFGEGLWALQGGGCRYPRISFGLAPPLFDSGQQLDVLQAFIIFGLFAQLLAEQAAHIAQFPVAMVVHPVLQLFQHSADLLQAVQVQG